MAAPLLNPYVVQQDMMGYTQGQFIDRLFDAAAKYGIVFLLDLHVLSVEAGIQEMWYDPKIADEARILEVWEDVLKHVAWRWNLMGIDIKNEPHGVATWGKGKKTDWNVFAERAIRQLAEKVPAYGGLFFVEGVEANGNPFARKDAYWWGGNVEGVKHAPIRTGRDDLDKRVVYSPHIYGPEVFGHHSYVSRSSVCVFYVVEEAVGQKTRNRSLALPECLCDCLTDRPTSIHITNQTPPKTVPRLVLSREHARRLEPPVRVDREDHGPRPGLRGMGRLHRGEPQGGCQPADARAVAGQELRA